MAETSPEPIPRDIPVAVKRQVRKRCGFGCVLCGRPFYHYDHMHGFDPLKPHPVDDITLLCAGHHDEKTRGLLPLEEVLEANRNPRAVEDGVTSPFGLHFSGTSITIGIASNLFEAPMSADRCFPIVVDDIPLIAARVEDGELLLDMTLLDVFNNPWLLVRSNELVMSSGAEDIEFTGKKAGGSHLVVKNPEGAAAIEMDFDVPDQLTIVRGSLFCNGVWLDLSPDALSVNGQSGLTLVRSRFTATTGIKIGSRGGYAAAISITNVPRYQFPVSGEKVPESDGQGG